MKQKREDILSENIKLSKETSELKSQIRELKNQLEEVSVYGVVALLVTFAAMLAFTDGAVWTRWLAGIVTVIYLVLVTKSTG